jgi:uncharacterized RDD family membrane protein YckC
MEKDISNKAGFWIRFLAIWVDFLLIYAILKLLFYSLLFSSVYIYFNFQFAFFILLIVYSALSIAFKGQTAGKWLLNITVYNTNGEKLSFIKSVFRESIAKIFSAAVLFLGFLWIGFTTKKRGWHDYLVGSTVKKDVNSIKGVFIWRVAAILSFIVPSGFYLAEIVPGIYQSWKMEIPTARLDLPFLHRSPSTLTEVSNIKQDTPFTSWIKKKGQSPEDYLVRIATEHKVTLLGEIHDQKDNLEFLNTAIPDLYFKSGVRCIGMEVIPADMNKSIEKLVNNEQYDDELAMKIARSQPWQIWGDKEYWDVLKTVWKLNKRLPANAPKMRLIGLDGDWAGPDIGVLNIGADKRGNAPFLEKFKILPAIKDIFIEGNRESIMASNIEEEMIKKGDKGVALVGFSHTMPQLGYPIIQNHKVVTVQQRMGLLLGQKYKNQVFAIELFQPLDPDVENKAHPPVLQSFIETVLNKSDKTSVGFSIKNSPFEFIRDSYSDIFDYYPSICYVDVTAGLIVLKPLDKMQRCTWIKGYISDEMYMKYKPFYELVAKQRFTNAKEVNAFFKRKLEDNF